MARAFRRIAATEKIMKEGGVVDAAFGQELDHGLRQGSVFFRLRFFEAKSPQNMINMGLIHGLSKRVEE